MRISHLKIVFQSRVSSRARKSIIRRDDADGPYRNREIEKDVDILVGPDSGANLEVRKLISDELRKHKPGEIFFYVVAEFDRGRNIPRYFKTIVPRRAVPAL